MIETLVVIVCLSTFLMGCVAVVEDIDRQIEKAQLDEQWDDGPEPPWIVEVRAEIDGLPELEDVHL